MDDSQEECNRRWVTHRERCITHRECVTEEEMGDSQGKRRWMTHRKSVTGDG